jgi:hypothetical protein
VLRKLADSGVLDALTMGGYQPTQAAAMATVAPADCTRQRHG